MTDIVVSQTPDIAVVAGPAAATLVAGVPSAAVVTVPSQGPQGIQGPTGAASSVPGPPGATGAQGPIGLTGAASTVPGPTGPQGNPTTVNSKSGASITLVASDIAGAEQTASKGVAGGYAGLDSGAKVLSANLNFASLVTAQAGTDTTQPVNAAGVAAAAQLAAFLQSFNG